MEVHGNDDKIDDDDDDDDDVVHRYLTAGEEEVRKVEGWLDR